MTIGGVVLAGGAGTRMGGVNKALLRDGAGVRFLDRQAAALAGLEEKLLSTNSPDVVRAEGFRPVRDAQPGRGPLAGVCAALEVCRSDALVVLACDMPLVTARLVEYLIGFAPHGWSAWAVQDADGRLQPLCGVYTRACLPRLQEALEHGEYEMRAAFLAAGGQTVTLAGTPFSSACLRNINTPGEYMALRAVYRDK